MLLRSRGLLAELGTKPLGLSPQLLALTSEFSLDVFDSQRRVTLRRDGRVLAAPLLRLLLESDHSDHSGLEGSGNLSWRLHQRGGAQLAMFGRIFNGRCFAPTTFHIPDISGKVHVTRAVTSEFPRGRLQVCLRLGTDARPQCARLRSRSACRARPWRCC